MLHSISSDATTTQIISRTYPYFNRENYAAYNTAVEAEGRENISQNFKNKIEALRAESDLYECNEFEVAVLTGAPLWRLRDFRSAKNNYYPFVKLPKPKSDETRKVKRDVRKVVYPLGRLRAALNSI